MYSKEGVCKVFYTGENRRQHERILFQYPLFAKLMFNYFGRKPVSTKKYAPIYIRDMSAGGLRFSSHLDLPIDKKILYLFETTLLDQTLKIDGELLRKEENKTFFEYGVRFIIDKQEQDSLLVLLNTLTVKLKENPLLKSCSFCEKDETNLFTT